MGRSAATACGELAITQVGIEHLSSNRVVFDACGYGKPDYPMGVLFGSPAVHSAAGNGRGGVA